MSSPRCPCGHRAVRRRCALGDRSPDGRDESRTSGDLDRLRPVPCHGEPLARWTTDVRDRLAPVRRAPVHRVRQLQPAAISSPRAPARSRRPVAGPAHVAARRPRRRLRVGSNRHPHATPGLVAARHLCHRRTHPQQRRAVQHALVRADVAHPLGSRHARLARVAAGTLERRRRMARACRQHQTTRLHRRSLSPAQAPVESLPLERRHMGGELCHRRRRIRPGRGAAVARCRTLAHLAGQLPQRVVSGLRRTTVVGVAGTAGRDAWLRYWRRRDRLARPQPRRRRGVGHPHGRRAPLGAARLGLLRVVPVPAACRPPGARPNSICRLAARDRVRLANHRQRRPRDRHVPRRSDSVDLFLGPARPPVRHVHLDASPAGRRLPTT